MTEPTETPPHSPAGSRAATLLGRVTGAGALLQSAALIPVLIALLIVGSLVSSSFFTTSNLISGVGAPTAALGMVVAGEALILLIGGMDISLESTYGLAPMIGAWLIVSKSGYGQGAELAPVLGILAVLLVGAAVGLFNGVMIVKGKMNGFVFTLGMTILVYGLQIKVVNGQSVGPLPSAFAWIGYHQFGDIPASLILAALIFIALGLFLRFHRLGRAIYAVGGNPAAARAAGIKVDRIKIGTYIAGSVLGSIGGLMEAGHVSSVQASQGYGEGIIFQVFAAAVIGGVSLRGGRGNMFGAACGVILLELVLNILDLGNVSSYWTNAIEGAVILLALVLSRVIGGAEAE